MHTKPVYDTLHGVYLAAVAGGAVARGGRGGARPEGWLQLSLAAAGIRRTDTAKSHHKSSLL